MHLAQASYARLVLPSTSDAAHRQKLLEASVYDVALSRLRYSEQKIGEMGLSGGAAMGSKELKRWMWEWHQRLVKRLEAGIKEVVKSETAKEEGDDIKAKARAKTKSVQTNHLKSDSHISQPPPAISSRVQPEAKLGPFLSLLTPTKLSLITILEIMRLQGTGGINEGMKTARALLSVGKSVEMEYVAEVLKKRGGVGVGGAFANTMGGNGGGGLIPFGAARAFGRRQRLLNRLNDSNKDNGNANSESPMTEATFFSPATYKTLNTWRSNALAYEDSSIDWTASWTQALRARVGSFLVDLLMDVATVTRSGVDRRTGEAV